MPNLSSTNIHDCGRITAEDGGGGSHCWLSVEVMGEGRIASFALHDIPPRPCAHVRRGNQRCE